LTSCFVKNGHSPKTEKTLQRLPATWHFGNSTTEAQHGELMTPLASQRGEEHFKCTVWSPNAVGNLESPKEARVRQEKKEKGSCDQIYATLEDVQHTVPNTTGVQATIW